MENLDQSNIEDLLAEAEELEQFRNKLENEEVIFEQNNF
jgi:hypothetical protein